MPKIQKRIVNYSKLTPDIQQKVSQAYYQKQGSIVTPSGQTMSEADAIAQGVITKSIVSEQGGVQVSTPMSPGFATKFGSAEVQNAFATDTKMFEDERKKQEALQKNVLKDNFKPGIVTRTLKRGDKTITYDIPESLAKDPSELGIYGRLDLLTGGRLPYGVSKRYAKEIKQEEYALRDYSFMEDKNTFSTAFGSAKSAEEKETRSLIRRDYLKVASIPPAIVAGVSLGFPVIATAVMNPVTTISSTALIIGTGAIYQGAVTTFGKTYKTKAQEAMLQNPKAKKAIFESMAYGKEVESKFEKDVYTTKEISQDIFGGRKKAIYESAVRTKLKESGLFKQDYLNEAVAFTSQRRKVSMYGEWANVIGSGVGSEKVARTLYVAGTKALTKKGVTLSLTNKLAIASKSMSIAGIGEGMSIDIGYTASGTLPVNPIRTIGAGIGGGASARFIGTPIAKYSMLINSNKALGKVEGSLIPKVKLRLMETFAYGTDFGEKISDTIVDVSEYATGKTMKLFGKEKIPTPTYTFDSGSTARAYSYSTPKSSATSFSQTQPKGFATKVKDFSVSSFVDIKSTSKTISDTVKTRFGRRRRTNIISSTFEVAPVSKSIIETRTRPVAKSYAKTYALSKTNILSNIQTNINTNTKINNLIKTNTFSTAVSTPININTILNTKVPAKTNTKITSNIMVAVPTIPGFLLPWLPDLGGGSRRKGYGKALAKELSYTPSLVATALGIRSRKVPKMISSLEVRPIAY